MLNDATRDAEARHTSRLARVETAVADAVDAVAEQLTAFKSETPRGVHGDATMRGTGRDERPKGRTRRRRREYIGGGRV